MAERRGNFPSGVKITYVDPTPPLAPVNVAPTLVQVDQPPPGPPIQDPEDVAGPSGAGNRHEPLDLNLLDEVDEGVRRINVAPLTPKSRRLKELEEMVDRQSAKHRATCREAQDHHQSCQQRNTGNAERERRSSGKSRSSAVLSLCIASPFRIWRVPLDPSSS